MKRISTSTLATCTVLGALALASACSSGDDPPGTNNGGSSGAGGKASSGGSAGSNGGSSGASGSSGSGAGTAGASGSGTGGSAGTAPVTGVCAGKVRELPLAEAFVDDFETPTRFGGWYSFADTASTSFQMIARAAGGALSTAMAGHVSATGVKAPTAMGFGAGFGFGMKDAMQNCAGISAFDGVSFWAKGTAGATNALTFQAVLAATQMVMDGGTGGDCTTGCYMHPSKTVTLTADWKQFTATWVELVGPTKVSGIILGLNWITPGPALDIWIDEVILYKGTPPTGPVGGADGGT